MCQTSKITPVGCFLSDFILFIFFNSYVVLLKYGAGRKQDLSRQSGRNRESSVVARGRWHFSLSA